MSRLTTFERLNEVVSQLHDCPIDLDKAVFDRAAHEWRGTFLRPLWESPGAVHKRRALIIVDSRLPIAEGALCFRQVTDVRILNDQGIGTYTLNKAKRMAGGLRFSFNEALELEILFEGVLDATYDERPLPGYTAVYRQYLFAQTGPEIEFARPAS
jgi:hypothetical protein